MLLKEGNYVSRIPISKRQANPLFGSMVKSWGCVKFHGQINHPQQPRTAKKTEKGADEDRRFGEGLQPELELLSSQEQGNPPRRSMTELFLLHVPI